MLATPHILACGGAVPGTVYPAAAPTAIEPTVPSCARCHAATGVDDRYCMACGHRLGEPVRPEAAVPAHDDPTDSNIPVVRVEEEFEPGLVACPACGTSNAGRRRRCARCGAGLRADGAVPLEDPVVEEPSHGSRRVATWRDTGERPEGSRPAPPRRGLGAGVAVVGLGIVLGAGVGAAAGMGLGPFATVEAVRFDADAYPTDPESLRPATAGSSSTADATGGRTFGPELTVDGDLATAWRTDGEGRGARLRHAFVEPVWLDRVEVAVGDQGSDAAFGQVGTPTRVTIDLGTQRVDATLAEQSGMQLVELPDPVLVDQVTWELTRVDGGRSAAVSEVVYVGWQADEADQEAFRER